MRKEILQEHFLVNTISNITPFFIFWMNDNDSVCVAILIFFITNFKRIGLYFYFFIPSKNWSSNCKDLNPFDFYQIDQ
jgi:hypothetical protein